MPVALIAEFEVPAEDLDRFIDAARQELLAVRENEPGCLRFDVVLFEEGRGRGAFVEVFADRQAAVKHRELAHFKDFFDAIAGIDVRWTTRHGEALG